MAPDIGKKSPTKPTQQPSALKPEPKLESKTEAMPTSAFPGQPFDQKSAPSRNLKSNNPRRSRKNQKSKNTTIASTAPPAERPLLSFEMYTREAPEISSIKAKVPSAFDRANRGCQSAGFRKRNKDISAGPAFAGFHLGKHATSPSKIEGPSWLKKATKTVVKLFKSQNENLNPTHASIIPDCKLTEKIVKEVCAIQQGETAGLQKSVITNVPISQGFPGISFVTHGQGAADEWSEQFPNAFSQQGAEENMDKNTDRLHRDPARRGEQMPTNKPADEVESDPSTKKRTANVAETGQVGEVLSPNKISKANPSPSAPPMFCIGELSKASGDEITDVDEPKRLPAAVAQKQ